VFGLDLFAFTLFCFVANSCTLVLAGMVLPLSAVAVLAVNMKPVQLMLNVLQRIHAASLPTMSEYVSRHSLDDFRVAWVTLARTSIFLNLAVIGAYAAWAPRLIVWWTSADMNLGGMAVMMLAFLPLRNALFLVFVEPLFCFKRMCVVRTRLMVEMCVLVALTLLLGHAAGTVGLLAALHVSLLGGSVLVGGREICKLGGLRGDVRFPWRAVAGLAGLLVLSIVMPPACWSLATHTLVIVTIAFGGIYCALFYALVLDTRGRKQVHATVTAVAGGLSGLRMVSGSSRR
jgi:O-antigen/teichoic acid export membrane protein